MRRIARMGRGTQHDVRAAKEAGSGWCQQGEYEEAGMPRERSMKRRRARARRRLTH